MAGEMYSIDPVTGIEPDGTEWPYHRAMAAAVGGTIQPFDSYQGPYVLVGEDSLIGNTPYRVLGGPALRLWLVEDYKGLHVWREDIDRLSSPIWDDPILAADAAWYLVHTCIIPNCICCEEKGNDIEH